jgi:hypothetical protein
MSILPTTLSKNRVMLHMIIEKDAQALSYGTSSFTLQISSTGEPLLDTLKVTSAQRTKYGK